MLARRLLGASKRNEIKYVGGNSGSAINGANVTVSLTALTGGIGSSAQPGDIVIAAYCLASGAVSARSQFIRVSSTGTDYTLIGSQLYGNDSSDTNLRVAYRILSTAETSVWFAGSAVSSESAACVVQVWRGVNSTTPIDVTPTTATGTNGGIPNPPSITPSTPGSKIVVVGASAGPGAIGIMSSGYLSGVSAANDDTNSARIEMGAVNWTGGAYDPAVFASGTTSTSASWAAMTFALRPSP